MKCELPQGSKIKVVLKKLTSSAGVWWYATGSNWLPTIFNGQSQTFSTVGPTISDVAIHFRDHGAAEVQIYENDDTTPTHVKGYLW